MGGRPCTADESQQHVFLETNDGTRTYSCSGSLTEGGGRVLTGAHCDVGRRVLLLCNFMLVTFVCYLCLLPLFMKNCYANCLVHFVWRTSALMTDSKGVLTKIRQRLQFAIL